MNPPPGAFEAKPRVSAQHLCVPHVRKKSVRATIPIPLAKLHLGLEDQIAGPMRRRVAEDRASPTVQTVHLAYSAAGMRPPPSENGVSRLGDQNQCLSRWHELRRADGPPRVVPVCQSGRPRVKLPAGRHDPETHRSTEKGPDPQDRGPGSRLVSSLNGTATTVATQSNTGVERPEPSPGLGRRGWVG